MSRLSQLLQLAKPYKIEAISKYPRAIGFCTKASGGEDDVASPPEAAPEPVKAAPKPSEPAFIYNSPATPADPGHVVGPGASKSGEYPNTEYYTYDKMSYFDLEVEMSSDRVEQPSADNGHF